ncbi:DUF2500 domain-containing protein [Bacillus sp. SCS-151]|uniref:DUF2500 domain-containing protein n=1 Tax=Nanhaiella sioensis TaxID=3115293 RepID=UPI00397B8285
MPFNNFNNGFEQGFELFQIIPYIVIFGFIMTFGIFIFVAITGMKQWNHNNNQPVLTVNAIVVTKRMNVRRRTNHHNDHPTTRSSTTYYATFEVESGDRMELQVSGKEYGMLVEGDQGKLTFQGSRYKGFTRS